METTAEVIGGAVSHPAKPRSPPCVRVALQQAIKGGSGIAVDLEVFRFDVDHDEFAALLVNVDLWPDHTLEDFIPSLGEF
ncbi:MAG: hypothetical protein ABEK84_10575 [Salinibacter sp.]